MEHRNVRQPFTGTVLMKIYHFHKYSSDAHFRSPRFTTDNENFMKEDVISYGTKYNIMYIMRGLPGSGKSTIAQRIQQLHPDRTVVICSADNFR